MGDIGKTKRKIELEPLPASEPVQEPSPDVTPEPEPAKAPEPVPA